jgi:hypothetical protein
MMADIVSSVYQKDNKTSTRDIPYSNNTLLNYLLKKYYAFSQLVAVSNLMLTRGYENPFIIMFPIHLSTFLMTLVRKNIITNNQWHVFYALSLLVPYILNADVINGGNDKFNVSLVFIVNRLVFNFEKYTNMCALTFLYNALYVTKV